MILMQAFCNTCSNFHMEKTVLLIPQKILILAKQATFTLVFAQISEPLCLQGLFLGYFFLL